MKKSICYQKKDCGLLNINFEPVDEQTFDKTLKKLMKQIYETVPSKTTTVPHDDPGIRESFQKTFTDWLTDQIQEFKSEAVMLYILTSVLNPLLLAYKNYKKVEPFLLYRGGNVLKMYKDKFINTLSEESSNKLSEYFDKFFESSDIDFMIFFDEDKIDSQTQKKVRKEVQALCHYSLSVCRDLILYCGDIYPFCDDNDEVLFGLFSDLLTKVNEDKKTSKNEFVRSCDFVGIGFNDFWVYDICSEDCEDEIPEFLRFDLESTNQFNPNEINNKNTATIYHSSLIRSSGHSGTFDFISIEMIKLVVNYLEDITFFKDPKLLEIKKEILNDLNNLHYLFITNNTKIHNIINMIYFKLSRLFMCFSLVYHHEDKYGMFNGYGEVYDLSIINKGDIMYHIYKIKNTYERKIKFEYKGNDMSVQVRIPKMKLAIEDLSRILFFKRFPWSDNKYEKRVYRLYLLLFIYSLKKTSRENVKKELKGLDKFTGVNDKESVFDIKMVRRNYNYMTKFKLRSDNSKKLKEFYELIVNIEDMLLDVLD